MCTTQKSAKEHYSPETKVYKGKNNLISLRIHKGNGDSKISKKNYYTTKSVKGWNNKNQREIAIYVFKLRS